MNTYTTTRTDLYGPEQLLAQRFGTRFKGSADGIFSGSQKLLAAGVCGLPFKAPVMAELTNDPDFSTVLTTAFSAGFCLLIVVETDKVEFITEKSGAIAAVSITESLKKKVLAILAGVSEWAGHMDENGSHIINLKTPSPGPHFFVNLLLGNRIGFDHPLQTTPKSVVDRLGRGSFRSHAATQVLATRWDLRQEENGFPCNRQFYLTENGKQIFYSANPEDQGISKGTCRHSRNFSEISYETTDQLTVDRSIFLLPQEDNLPLAVEVQRISITNAGSAPRKLRLVYTGMFGPSKPGALQEDVLYSTIIMESGVLRKADGSILAVSPSYQPIQDRDDRRFHTMVLHDSKGTRYPTEFCLDYTEFTGRGTLEKPAGLPLLQNRMNRKGPGFFALAGEIDVAPGETAVIDNFTGLVSKRGNSGYCEASLEHEVSELARRYSNRNDVPRALSLVKKFQDEYSSFLKLDNGDRDFSVYCSNNLPFQVLYQSFVSRSFAQTQKGYREIGFREIQDIFASLYYFHAHGESHLVRQLILDWTAQVFEFGYANHNFFWEGKEAGKWSDDALWLHQAVGRYVHLTGDISILDQQVPLADHNGKSRSLFETLKAALRYSCEISVGAHGLPLLDLADWNDCLKLDKNYLSGPEKEKMWKKDGRFESRGTESIMNGFLAVTAAKNLLSMAEMRKDSETTQWAKTIVSKLTNNLRSHAWIGQNYARLLFNQYPGFTHAGAAGDGLDTDSSGGTFFLNSFSWSILSGVADEAQIASMLRVFKEKLKTPFGLKLVSPMDLSRIVPGVATSEYFPGDRENGAVFKHAAMMAVAALFEASKTVSDKGLAQELASEAWAMIDLACPVRSLANPFVLAGNPRFCTQYNNSETGENIGPLLSGTATWMILSLMKGLGIDYTDKGLVLDPILREEDQTVHLNLKAGKLTLEIEFQKPKGFFRAADGNFLLTVDGKPQKDNLFSLEGKTGTCVIQGVFK